MSTTPSAPIAAWGSARRSSTPTCYETTRANDETHSSDANWRSVGGNVPPSWYGSIIEDQQDASGYQYKRNRYYDPQGGRFTQEDPLGLAGGFNVYGFSGGDPVNFTDPFGLQAEQASEAAEDALEKYGPELDEIASEAEGAVEGFFERMSNAASRAANRISERLNSLRSQIRNIKNEAGRPDHLDTAAQETKGTLQVPKPGGGYFDHVTETRNAMNGLKNSINTLNKTLANPNLSAAQRKDATELLSKASKTLDAMEQAMKQ